LMDLTEHIPNLTSVQISVGKDEIIFWGARTGSASGCFKNAT
jgi:hypothetical protein